MHKYIIWIGYVTFTMWLIVSMAMALVITIWF